jgi:arylsulfatase A-like enzyme
MKAKGSTRNELIKWTALCIGLYFCGILLHSCTSEKIKPNIIFILTDDQRWNALGCAGNKIIQTPNMDKLAAEGIRFEKAFVTTPICAASRASIFTGLYERKTGFTFGQPPLPKKYTDISYPKLLKDAGYRTGFVGKFGIKVPEEVISEWFDYYKPTHWPYFQKIEGHEKHLTDINVDLAINFINNNDMEKPFCLSLSTWAPHADDGEEQQYFWPAACDSLYKDVEIPHPVLGNPAYFDSLPEFVKKSMNRIRWHWRFDNPVKYQNMVKGYYRMISGIDMALGRLLGELKKSGKDKNTVIIFMGDNGYFLGERGFAGKWTMHDLSIRVPLIIFDPRNSGPDKNRVDENMVLNVDVTPTILDLAGVPVPGEMQGRSLVPVISGDNVTGRKEILTEHLWDRPEIPITEAVRTNRWKYIRYPQHPEYEELYDIRNDPDEKINLAMNADFTAIRNMMQKRCDDLIKNFSQ